MNSEGLLFLSIFLIAILGLSTSLFFHLVITPVEPKDMYEIVQTEAVSPVQNGNQPIIGSGSPIEKNALVDEIIALHEKVESASVRRFQRVILTSRNNFGEEGTADIKGSSGSAWIDRLEISIFLKGTPSNTIRPAYIQAGSCDRLGEIQYVLDPVTAIAINGQSDTILNVSTYQIYKELPLAVAVYESEDELQNIVACGDIEAVSIWTKEAVSRNLDVLRDWIEKTETAKNTYDFSYSPLGDDIKRFVEDSIHASLYFLQQAELAYQQGDYDQAGDYWDLGFQTISNAYSQMFPPPLP